MKKQQIESVIQELTSAAKTYYQDFEEPAMSDAEYDAKLDFLLQVRNSENFPDLFGEGTKGSNLLEGTVAAGTSIPKKRAVKHLIPMLSLGKAKTPADLSSYVTRLEAAGETRFKLQAKLDGIAISVTYENSKLSKIATRGDGENGEDITFLVSDPNVSIKGLPKTLEKDCEVRGELFLTNQQFLDVDESRTRLTGVHFKNSRNAAAGLIKRSEFGVEYPVEFTFSTYTTIENGRVVDEVPEGLISVQDLTKELVGGMKIEGIKSEELSTAIDKFGKIRKNFPIPTDGVVIKPMMTSKMYEKMGVSSHHPRSQVAWKYPTEQATSEVLAITYTVGKSGRVTPRAEISPVEVDGSTVSYASLHNFAVLRSLDVRVGSKVVVEKANEIIPQIVTVVFNGEETTPVEIPKNCPHCNTRFISEGNEWPPKLLICPNTSCHSREMFALKAAVGRGYLDIDRLGEVTLESLFNGGVISDIGDLYSLTKENLSDSFYGYTIQGNPRKLGETISEDILTHIEASKTLPLERIIGSLAITGLGRRTAKKLLKVFPGISELSKASVDELVKIEGIGEITAKQIVNGLSDKAPVIAKLRAAGVVLELDKTEEQGSNNLFSGNSYSISGKVPASFKNRNELVEFIEANGGEFHSSPRAGTTHMIGDPSSTSSKIKRAISLGTTIISPEEFDGLVNS